MHDFIQSLAFSPGRALLAARSAAPGWVQRGIMRSFGEDEGVASFRASPRPPARRSRKPRTRDGK